VFRSEFDATYDLAWLLADPEQRTPLYEVPRWPTLLHALLVDEMHDMNRATHTIVQALLATTSARFCGVGDRDQVIFSNNGAEEKFMSNQSSFGERIVTSLPLTRCHRFGIEVANVASKLAGGKKYSVHKGLETVVIKKFYADSGELNCTALAMEQISHWKKENAHDVSNVALLLRHSWQSVDIENSLIETGIFYETHGFDSYFFQPEVLLIRALHAIGTRDYTMLGTVALRQRMIETLIFFFGIEVPYEESENESFLVRMNIAKKAAIQDGDLSLFIENILLRRCSEKVRLRLSRAISIFEQRASNQNDFNEILKSIEIDQWVEEVFIEKQRKKDAVRYFNALSELSIKYSSIETFLAKLSEYEKRKEVTSVSENTQYLRASNFKRKTLNLSLVSEVKGLEFDNVLIPHLAEGIFPSDMAYSATEERNLLYVAMTRAKKNLTLLISERKPSSLLISDDETIAA
jgi:DNA helicase II / ATP-dependent DNA helicase PcrA